MKVIYDLLDDFLGLLFPRICYGCGNHLMRNENVICTECHVVIPQTGYHTQPGNPVEQLFWGRCLIDRAAAYSFYNKGSRVRRLIHSFKYKGVKEIGAELGRIYGSQLKSSGFLDGIEFILPVPLHPSKERKRGFNQSRVISESISSVSDIEVLSDVLVRTSRTQTQTKRSRYDRWTNIEGRFHVISPDKLKGKHILLVDDVITTGATIESCVQELAGIEDMTVSVAALACAVI